MRGSWFKNSIFFLSITLPAFVQAQWSDITMPGGLGGAVYSVCAKDSFLFAGTDAGIFRSSDNGEHWKKVNPLFLPREFTPTAMSIVANGPYIIAGFREPDVYISSDNGESWTAAGLLAIAGRRATPSEIGASGDWVIGGGSPFPAYQSINNGVSWEQIPSSSNLSSAVVQDSIALFAQPNIYRSNDSGKIWTLVRSLASYSKTVLAISGNRAFAGNGVNGSSGKAGFIVSSTNRGLTWDADSASLDCNEINAIVFAPSSSGNNFVFAATDSGVFQTSDIAAHWDKVNTGLGTNLVFSLTFKTEGTGGTPILFAGTGNGMYKSTDFGQSWIVTGTPSDWIYSTTDKTIFAATSNNTYRGATKYWNSAKNRYQIAIYSSTDDGNSWIESFKGSLDSSAQITSICATATINGETSLFAGGTYYTDRVNGIILSSTNNGEEWSTEFVYTLARSMLILGANSTGVFASYSPWSPGLLGIFHCGSVGSTWTKVDSTMFFPKAIAFDGEKVYSGFGDYYSIGFPVPKLYNIISIIISKDKGLHWESLASPLDSSQTKTVSVNDPISIVQSMYASGPHLVVGLVAIHYPESLSSTPTVNGGGMYHLYNDGSKWTIADTLMTGRQYFSLAGYGSTIFAATDSGVFRTTNWGVTWEDINNGMNHLRVSSLFISGDFLYASTMNGFWKCPLSAITSVENESLNRNRPINFGLSQNYPNPFNPSTVIKYQLPVNCVVMLKIFDLLGREVQTLINKLESAGNHSAIFNAGNLSSGVYFYQLKAGNFVETKKLLLLK